MHSTVKNLLDIESNIKIHLDELKINNIPKIIAVSKTFKIDKILPLLDHGHIDFGENKVQEAVEKWTNVKKENKKIKLHLIGRLQTNKVKIAVNLFIPKKFLFFLKTEDIKILLTLCFSLIFISLIL